MKPLPADDPRIAWPVLVTEVLELPEQVQEVALMPDERAVQELCNVRTQRMNATAERWIGGCRRGRPLTEADA
jgi:hypothetical protein